MGKEPLLSLSNPEVFLQAEKIIRNQAWMLVGLFGFTEHDVSDIKQELFLELYKRLENFDPEKSKETTFIARVTESKVIDLINQRQAECRDWRKCQDSLNDIITLPDVGVIERIDTLECEPNCDPHLILDVTLVLEQLPPGLRRLCLALKHYGKTEVLEDCPVSKDVFYRKLQLLKDIFQQAGLDQKFPLKTFPSPV